MANLNDITFARQNGNIGQSEPSKDGLSGLLLSIESGLQEGVFASVFEEVAVGGGKMFVKRLRYASQLVEEKEAFAMTEQASVQNFIQKQIDDFFGYAPEGELWLGVVLSGEISADQIKALQDFQGGELRQIGVASSLTATLTDETLTAYQKAADELEADHAPVSLIVAARKGQMQNAAALADFSKAGRKSLSVTVAQDLGAQADTFVENKHFHELADIGTALGLVAKAKVNQSISWVREFPVDMILPGVCTGEALVKVSKATLLQLMERKYLFVRRLAGVAGVYFCDSFTLDKGATDFGFIERERTMCKAIRGIRAKLLPYLGSPLELDATTGEMRKETVAHLETVAGETLEAMERAGELSGYKVVIDPAQNVLQTGNVEVSILNVPLGVMRNVSVKIGFSNKI